MVRIPSKRDRYGTKTLVEQALKGAPDGLPTRKLVTTVRGSAGNEIPYNTIFQAAKSLVKAGTATSERDGREYTFSLTKAAVTGVESPHARSELMEASEECACDCEGSEEPAFPQRLAPGEVLVLSHDGKSVVTLTNVHGKAQIERHLVA
jgi:hypothetical protein